MTRALLFLAGIVGGGAVFLAAVNARSPLDALQAVGAGVGLLLFVVGVGLADLIDIALRVAYHERRQAGRD